jgi:hypothetical protein
VRNGIVADERRVLDPVVLRSQTPMLSDGHQKWPQPARMGMVEGTAANCPSRGSG